MKFYKLIIPCLFIFQFSLNAQRQADNWVWGICTPDNGCPEPFGSGVMKFNDFGIESITSKFFDYRFTKGSASISDSLGNLLLVFNGKYLFDSTGAIIDSFYIGDFSEMLVGFKNSLFLNLPGQPDKYCLFNSYASLSNGSNIIEAFDSSFYYSEFKTSQIGIETSVRKQLISLDSSGAGTIAAIKHANGRDWWIIKSSVYQNKFYQALLDPSGFEFNTIYTSIPQSLQPGGGWNLFSSDGSKFVNIITGSIRKAYVYDFNRCTGEITNPVEHDMSNILSIDNYDPNCLSPDGTKLYILGEGGSAYFSRELIQYDFNTSETTYIADVNGGPSTTPNNLHVIVGSAIDTTEIPYISRLNVINNPNAAGLACENEEGVYNLLNYGFIDVSPNCANFRLGALAGSPCDTLFTGIINQQELGFRIFPNPVESILTIEFDIPSKCKINIIDMLGKIQREIITNNEKTVINKELENLKQGMYWLEIQDLKTGKRAGKKFIKK
jgi:hypothetical protein